MATPNFAVQNKFSTTLSSGITATDTTIPLTSLPTPSEGYVIIEPDSSTAWEEIYYTSKTGSAIVCPSVAAGRGQNGSTAASHSSGATVRMDTTKGMIDALQDATGLTGVHTNNQNYGFDFVASGCIWTGDSLGSTRAASMTSGVVYINGRRHTVAAVTSRTFTASKDTYVDLLYSTVDNVATPVYTEVTNNAASPALASNSIRIGIIVTGASSIAAAASINQGQEDRILPIASSIAYSVTDSLGNLICPRDPQRKVLGYRQRVTDFTTTTAGSYFDITGLSAPVIVPTGRKVRVTAFAPYMSTSNAGATGIYFAILESSTMIAENIITSRVASTASPASVMDVRSPAAGSQTYKVQGKQDNAGTYTASAGSGPTKSYILVELV